MTPPNNMDEARDRLAATITDIEVIQAQLGREPWGPPDQYEKWRSSAIAAMNHKHKERRDLKAWMSKEYDQLNNKRHSLLIRLVNALGKSPQNAEITGLMNEAQKLRGPQ